jgi:ribose transport system permease protein
MTAATEVARSAPGRAQTFRRRWADGGNLIYLVLLAAVLVAWLLVDLGGGDFVSAENFRSILLRSISLGIVAMGQTLVVLAGSLDLSVAYVISITTVVAASTINGSSARLPMGIGLVVGLGVVVGLVNGLVITRLRTNPFITTLGMSLVLQGVLQSEVSAAKGSVPPVLQALGYRSLGPVPLAVLLLLVVFGAVYFLQRHTPFGAHLYAVGGDVQTARLSGVRSDRVIVIAHVLCSLAAVVAGLFIVSRLGTGDPRVGPDGAYDLDSIAAVVVGGTALSGGRGGVGGTLAGVLLLSVLDSVFNALHMSSFVQEAVRGLVLIIAVAVYAVRNRRAEG